jgi:SAM-dependent methyltransferase
MNVSRQVALRADDLLTARLGNSEFDACLCGQITHYLTEQQDRDLFRRIHGALMPGGVLLLDVPMGTGQLSESASFLSLVLWANSGGTAYSFDTYRVWLVAAGFHDLTQLSERWLMATK